MSTSAASLQPLPASTPERIEVAKALAVTGKPVLGRPAKVAERFGKLDNPDSPIVLLAVTPSGLVVGMAAWEYPGPSDRIPSGKLIALSVNRRVRDQDVSEVVEFLLWCVPNQLLGLAEHIGKSGGYVVADIPKISPIGHSFSTVGWIQLQSSDTSSTDRYVSFIESEDEDDYLPGEEE